MYIQYSIAQIRNILISSSRADAARAAIHIHESTVNMSDGSFLSNAATNVGGFVSVTTATLTCRNMSVVNNTAPSSGGGIEVRGSGMLEIFDSFFAKNCVAFGGALVTESVALSVSNCIFHNNTAQTSGGAASFKTQSPPSLRFSLLRTRLKMADQYLLRVVSCL